jgi:hypothetical protein
VLVSLTDRDVPALGDVVSRNPDTLAAFRGALAAVGVQIERCVEPTQVEVDALASSWAKRLGVPSRRPACYVIARRCG